MDEDTFLSLMRKARTHSYLGVNADYWHGYQRGLRRGFLGDLFGTDDEHKVWMSLAEGGTDTAGRERGRGYRDGLAACGVAAESNSLVGSKPARGDLEDQRIRGYPGRR